MPKLLIRPFADIGDKSLPPDSDSSGFVNFSTGYTKDYEINLLSGNPTAKAVERPIQNALFNLLTDNQLWTQNHGFMQWFQDLVDGYDKYNMVTDQDGDGNWVPYMSRSVNNIVRPKDNASIGEHSKWEKIPLPSEMRSFIPHPLGGDDQNKSAPNKSIVLINSDFNSDAYKKNGTWIVPSDKIAATIKNIPIAIKSRPSEGTLDAINWSDAGSLSGMTVQQRFIDVLGYTYTRIFRAGSWGVWNQSAKPSDIQDSRYNIAAAVSNGQNTIQLTTIPSIDWDDLTVGASFRFQSPITNSGEVRLTFNNKTFPLISFSGNILYGEEIKKDGICEIIRAKTNFVLVYCNTGETTVVAATKMPHAVNLQQLTDVKNMILTYNDIYPVGIVIMLANGFDPNASFKGTKWARIPDGYLLRTTTSGQNPLSTGGSNSQILTGNNIPLHTHDYSTTTTPSGGGSFNTSTVDLGSKNTNSTGTHNHSYSGNTNTTGQHLHSFSGTTNSYNYGKVQTENAGSHHHGTFGSKESSGVYGLYNSEYKFPGVYRNVDSENPIWNSSTDGVHSHAFNIGAHSHTYDGSTSRQGDHNHSYSGNTNNAGEHSHSVAIGAHKHEFSLPNHTHEVKGTTTGYGRDGQNIKPIDIIPSYISMIAWRRVS